MSSSTLDHEIDGRYRHEAFFYADEDSFMSVTLAFIRDGVDAGETLVEPEIATVTLAFRHETLRDVRDLVATCASHAGLSDEKTANLVLAAYEISANSVEHGGGYGTIRIWIDEFDIVCEVRDGGTITDPMLGRVQPPADAQHGRGMWLANQLCDLVQIRAFPARTVTRLHVRRV